MRLFTATATVCLSLASLAPLYAQEAPSPGGPPPESSAKPVALPGLDTETLKVTVNLVNLYMSVRDKSGYITKAQETEILNELSSHADELINATPGQFRGHDDGGPGFGPGPPSFTPPTPASSTPTGTTA